ncbi:MAG: SDR family oxidoreductase [Thermoanaerobaculia bacterium]|nr:SDR family oxidoreductase [Thermoanaerobaculia bacterium]
MSRKKADPAADETAEGIHTDPKTKKKAEKEARRAEKKAEKEKKRAQKRAGQTTAKSSSSKAEGRSSPESDEKTSDLPPEMNPSNYIEKVGLVTDEVIDEIIEPEHLLVHHHRDYHLADIQARRFMSKLMESIGDESLVRQKMKDIRELGHRTSERIAKLLGRNPEGVSKTLFGLKRKEYYFRYKRLPHTAEEIRAALEKAKDEARNKLDAVTHDGRPWIRLLLTGGTGFVGQEIMWQSAFDDDIVEVVVLIRPKKIRDRRARKMVTLSPTERGQRLLEQLWLADTPFSGKYRFIAGDIELPRLGVSDEDYDRLQTTLTHVVHCAASVAFDDPYEESFRANVTGTLNALEFSRGLQEAEDSPLVSHLAIETSYIHGRQTKDVAREDEIVFPRNFYNNYYELTKAMASIETERYMLDHGLRVVQLCPAIVIGESRAGNNRGDTKVVNAPVNVFGRAHQALQHKKGNFFDRTRAATVARMALLFPGDPSAELNLIPVDRVVQGIAAALRRPDAVGERVHLATDNRLTSQQIRDIVKDELGVEVRLADPTVHRNVTLPVLSKILGSLKQQRLANALEKLGTIFGGYSEWGQPIHEVGNDVKYLGLSPERPNTQFAFRMLCRHNRYVQQFGAVRDPDEISRRERLWWNIVMQLERETSRPVGAMEPEAFQRAITRWIDPETFERVG